METALANPDIIPESELPPLSPEIRLAMQQLPRFLVAISLAEGETLRLILHTNQAILNWAGVALRTSDGALIEASRRFQSLPGSEEKEQMLDTAIQCLRFINNEMYFNPREISVLQGALEVRLRGSVEADMSMGIDFRQTCPPRHCYYPHPY